jgi:hypothetical protein
LLPALSTELSAWPDSLCQLAVRPGDGPCGTRAVEVKLGVGKAGKVSVSGFHEVNGDYVRSDHDNQAANNLLKKFKALSTREVVVPNR